MIYNTFCFFSRYLYRIPIFDISRKVLALTIVYFLYNTPYEDYDKIQPIINNFINNVIDTGLSMKLRIQEKIQDIIKKYYGEKDDYILTSAYLYTTLTQKYDVTEYLKKNRFLSKIDNNIILKLYEQLDIPFYHSNDIRIKFSFTYKEIPSILYYSYNNHNYIPYPPYSDEIMENYRLDIIEPHYLNTIASKKKYFYSLFQMESKDILTIEINNEKNRKLMEYFQLIQTPFCDFGILYDCAIPLKWILIDNDIEIDTFNDFYLSFINVYIDDETMELKEHFIKINNINERIISDRMIEIMVLKKSE